MNEVRASSEHRSTDWSAPIIIVGAGRSGTTRLSATLDAHRDVYMMGETSFLLPRLWATFYENAPYVRNARLGHLAQATRPDWQTMSWWGFWQGELERNLDRLGPLLGTLEEQETARLQTAFGAFIGEVLIPPSLRRPRWGFTEVWAGGEAFPYNWDLYRAAFPRAWFIQSVRHPVEYLRSAISHAERPDPDDADIVYGLRQWVAMVRHSRTLRDTGRYIEFRMEDFEAELPRILAGLGLSDDPACLTAASERYLPSPRRALAVAPEQIDAVEGLRAMAEDLGYDLDDDEPVRAKVKCSRQRSGSSSPNVSST